MIYYIILHIDTQKPLSCEQSYHLFILIQQFANKLFDNKISISYIYIY